MIEGKNFKDDPNPDVGGETEFFRCNFSQSAPLGVSPNKTGVRLFPDAVDGYVFVECNLCNAEPPPGSVLNGCCTVIKDFGVETSSDVVDIDGLQLSIPTYVDIIYGRYTVSGYEYFLSEVG